MSQKPLPLEYHLEIYEKSFVNDPTASFQGETPFMGFHVGDYVDPRILFGRGIEVPTGHWWKITAVVHRVWEIENHHVAHQVGLCVETTPRPY